MATSSAVSEAVSMVEDEQQFAVWAVEVMGSELEEVRRETESVVVEFRNLRKDLVLLAEDCGMESVELVFDGSVKAVRFTHRFR